MVFMMIIKIFFRMCLTWLGVMVYFQNFDEGTFKLLMESIPSQLAQWFGFLYLLFIVIKKGHDTYTSILLNKGKIRDGVEKTKQYKIETKQQQKNLDA